MPTDAALGVYKCHSNKKVAHVVCIICDNAYHISDFNRLKNTSFVSEKLVICPEHKQDELTSNLDEDTNIQFLNKTARYVIAQIKLQALTKAKSDLQQSILENSVTNCDSLNKTILDGENDDVLNAIKTENQLLRDLNAEIKDKNLILKELIEKFKADIPTTLSYASAINNVKNNSQLSRSKTIQVPNLIIKAKKQANAKQTYVKVVQNLQNKIILPIDRVINKMDGSVTVKCKNLDDVECAKTNLINHIGKSYDIEVEKLSNPRLKIVGLENKMNQTELQNDLWERNFSEIDGSCEVIHIFEATKNKNKSAIISVTPKLYAKIRQNNYKVFIGHQCCQAYDDINISPCTKCGRTGHSANKCLNTLTCLKCSGNHLTNDCKSQNLKCSNCIYSNEKYNTKFDAHHAAYDDVSCHILKNKINKIIATTDYPLSPKIYQIKTVFEKKFS